MITDRIRSEVTRASNEHFAKTGYDQMKQHVDLVVKEALQLGRQYGADLEIVELAALLHDISLFWDNETMADYATRKENHHIDGAKIAEELLSKYKYPADKITRVKDCILHHRSSINANRATIEEQVIADADALAHFDNIPMLFQVAFILRKMSIDEARQSVINGMKKDFAKLSPATQKLAKARYENIVAVIQGEM